MSIGGRKDCHGLSCLVVVLLSLDPKAETNHHDMHKDASESDISI